MARVLDIEAAGSSAFPIQLSGRPDDLPIGSSVRILGLPDGATLSSGQFDAGRGWVVPVGALQNLKISLPPGISGHVDVIVALIDNDQFVLGGRVTELRIKAIPAQHHPGRPELAMTHAPEVEAAGATAPVSGSVAPQPGINAVRLPSHRPASIGSTHNAKKRAAMPATRLKLVRRTPRAHQVGMATASHQPNRCRNKHTEPCNIAHRNVWWPWRPDLVGRGARVLPATFAFRSWRPPRGFNRIAAHTSRPY
jgi:hypothetical protein